MREFSKMCLVISTILYFNGCGSSSSEYDGVISSSDSKSIGSLSSAESLDEVLKDRVFKEIDIDLDKYRYDQDSALKSYNINMYFSEYQVSGLADCNRFSANYKVRDGELSFSKIHFELASDLTTCEGFMDADDAINSFLSTKYTLSSSSKGDLVLYTSEMETSVKLFY